MGPRRYFSDSAPALHLEITSMLHSQMSYQVHSDPCSTDGACPALSLNGMLVVDVTAEADEVEVLAAEGAVVGLRPAARLRHLVQAGVRVVDPHVQIVARLQAPRGGGGRRRRGRRAAPHVSGVHGCGIEALGRPLSFVPHYSRYGERCS